MIIELVQASSMFFKNLKARGFILEKTFKVFFVRA